MTAAGGRPFSCPLHWHVQPRIFRGFAPKMNVTKYLVFGFVTTRSYNECFNVLITSLRFVSYLKGRWLRQIPPEIRGCRRGVALLTQGLYLITPGLYLIVFAHF